MNIFEEFKRAGKDKLGRINVRVCNAGVVIEQPDYFDNFYEATSGWALRDLGNNLIAYNTAPAGTLDPKMAKKVFRRNLERWIFGEDKHMFGNPDWVIEVEFKERKYVYQEDHTPTERKTDENPSLKPLPPGCCCECHELGHNEKPDTPKQAKVYVFARFDVNAETGKDVEFPRVYVWRVGDDPTTLAAFQGQTAGPDNEEEEEILKEKFSHSWHPEGAEVRFDATEFIR